MQIVLGDDVLHVCLAVSSVCIYLNIYIASITTLHKCEWILADNIAVRNGEGVLSFPFNTERKLWI